jgi:FkbM family methyltransferase
VRAANEHRHYGATDLRYVFPSGLEARIRNRAEWLAFTDIFVGRIYDGAISAALQTASPERTFDVLDLGANVGYFALRFLDLALQAHRDKLSINLILVEPTRSLCDELRTRLIPQIPQNVSVSLVDRLVGLRTGSAELYESAFHIGNGLIPDRFARKSLVPYVDLDNLTSYMKRIDLLKCDIEGAEQTFLENYPALLDRVEVGAMELHHTLNDSRRCAELLEQRGFRIHRTRVTEWFDEIWFQRS